MISFDACFARLAFAGGRATRVPTGLVSSIDGLSPVTSRGSRGSRDSGRDGAPAPYPRRAARPRPRAPAAGRQRPCACPLRSRDGTGGTDERSTRLPRGRRSSSLFRLCSLHTYMRWCTKGSVSETIHIRVSCGGGAQRFSLAPKLGLCRSEAQLFKYRVGATADGCGHDDGQGEEEER